MHECPEQNSEPIFIGVEARLATGGAANVIKYATNAEHDANLLEKWRSILVQGEYLLVFGDTRLVRAYDVTGCNPNDRRAVDFADRRSCDVSELLKPGKKLEEITVDGVAHHTIISEPYEAHTPWSVFTSITLMNDSTGEKLKIRLSEIGKPVENGTAWAIPIPES